MARGKFGGVLIGLQIAFLVLYAIFVQYDDSGMPAHIIRMRHAKNAAAHGGATPAPKTEEKAVVTQKPTVAGGVSVAPTVAETSVDGSNSDNSTSYDGNNREERAAGDEEKQGDEKKENGKHEEEIVLGGGEVASYYSMFQDVHVMMFIGFGFLMTFLKRYGFGSVGLNMVIAAFVLQWSMLFSGFFHLHGGKILVNMVTLLTSDFAAATILITFGALLGKTSPLQMIIIAFIEIIVFTVNEYIGLNIFQVTDVGGSMFVHTFGAYYGLALARVIYDKNHHENSKEGSVYHSDIFAMIGTVFLWLFWPSFNSAVAATPDGQMRAIINTYVALAACCCTAFAVSAIVSKESKFDMVHIQNATLAGGVAVGTSADLMISPFGAVIIGMLAGTLSVCGYKYLTPLLCDKLKIHDTCGVNNLHGMPGVFAGLAGIVAAAMATPRQYGESLYEIFPARAPVIEGGNSTIAGFITSAGRSAGEQAGYQALALVLTLVLAIVSGLLTGLLIKLPIFDPPRGRNIFDDAPWWETPEDFELDLKDDQDKPGKLLETTMEKEMDEMNGKSD